jgi:hypothetical protein
MNTPTSFDFWRLYSMVFSNELGCLKRKENSVGLLGASALVTDKVGREKTKHTAMQWRCQVDSSQSLQSWHSELLVNTWGIEDSCLEPNSAPERTSNYGIVPPLVLGPTDLPRPATEPTTKVSHLCFVGLFLGFHQTNGAPPEPTGQMPKKWIIAMDGIPPSKDAHIVLIGHLVPRPVNTSSTEK